ncbi:MAG: TraR/DksA family transcriptional regulator [Lautropia sp.]
MSRRFTTGQLARIESEIEARRKALQARIAQHRAGRSRAEQASDVLDQDFDDAPQRSADREIELALTDAEMVEMASLDLARRRLHDDSYGRCADCGSDIAYERLQALPWAERCVTCESAAERAGGRSRNASL